MSIRNSNEGEKLATAVRLVPYQPLWGNLVAGWATSAEEMRWLAPGTPPPLTAEKVSGWKKEDGHSLVGFQENDVEPVAYGELNPMKLDRMHYWIGHIVVAPRLRGQGLGGLFVQKLLGLAFLTERAAKVSLVVFPDNRAAIECYRKCGFRMVGEERHQFISGGERHRLLRFETNSLRITPRALRRSAQPVAH